MNALVITALSLSAISSATGMILFRYGGRGNTSIAEFFNVHIFLGCIVYMIGAIAALYSLSKVSAAQAYPFTVLHAVILYIYIYIFIRPSGRKTHDRRTVRMRSHSGRIVPCHPLAELTPMSCVQV